MHLNPRPITQFLMGLMLLFASITLFPRAVFLIRQKNYPKGLIFFFLGGLSLLLTVVAFAMAFFG